MDPGALLVVAEDEASTSRAAELARELGAAFGPGGSAHRGLRLVVGQGGLSLREPGGPSVTPEVAALAGSARPGRDPLWRAVLAGAEPVVDATAGLGADGFHLAARGATVTMIERSKVLAALLADALERGRSGTMGEVAAAAAHRIELVAGDAREVLPALGAERRGVVYLDPMFSAPAGRALPPKGMALLRRVLGAGDAEGADDGAELLRAARAAASRRVVVKRHLRAEPLGGVAPSGSLRGRTVRLDIYPPLESRGDR